MNNRINKSDVLDFWFKESGPKDWYKKDDDFDETLRQRFGQAVEQAIAGEYDDWGDDQEGCLALIILLDQFARNIFRDTPKAFAGDEKASKLSQICVARGYLENADAAHRQFMLMPMMHSEDLAVQDASLPLFKQYTNEQTYDFAVKHRDIVAKFGRFPHRNEILDRPSSLEEVEFLSQPGSSF